MNLFIIPGNPPAVHFYELWGQEIGESEPALELRVATYPELKVNSSSDAALEEVISAHEKQLQAFHEKVKSPIHVIGHSLGGYVALKLLQKDKNEIIKSAQLVHPFLKRPGQTGRLILRLAALLYEQKLLQRQIIQNRKYLEFFSQALPFVSNEEIEKAFHLGYHESKTIALDQRPVIIEAPWRDKVTVLYNSQDTWCPMSVVEELKKQVKVTACVAPHDFVISKTHRTTLRRILRF